MKRVVQIPNNILTYNAANQPIYTRFHRKPQIYPSSFQANKKNQINNLEEENVNSLISNLYKQKKIRGMLDPGAPNNKNIFVDTDSEVQRTEKNQEENPNTHIKKSTQLLICKTESQFPETYNSQTIFKRDGLTKGYYIKVNPKNDDNTIDYMNNARNRNKVIRTVFETPEPDLEDNMIFGYNNYPRTQIRPKKEINNYINYTDNGNIRKKDQFRNQAEIGEWLIDEQNSKNNPYLQNQDIQIGVNPIRDKLYKNKQYPNGMIYKKNNVSYTKSNVTDLSMDNFNQQKKQQNENNNMNNYIIAGTGSGFASPDIEAENNSEENENQNEYVLCDDQDYNNYQYIPQKNVRNNIMEQNVKNGLDKDQGGKVDLSYSLMNNKKDSHNINSLIRRKRVDDIANIIENDEYKFNSLIKLQRFIKSYLYLREICAMKIQAVWRGCNTRKIMDLYNNLDEFIYHLSKVQFNHFNNDFCFFIKQLFNIYKAKVNISVNDSNEENNEYEMDINNEICDTELMQERAGFFDPEKLETENEIALVVEAENDYSNSKKYDKLKKDYDDLRQRYIDLQGNQNNILVTTNKRAGQKKNEPESTIGSMKSDYKLRFGTNSRDNTNYRGYSEKRYNLRDKENNSFSNDYDADLEMNREDDFFNQENSYDDKDNSGTPMNIKFNYLSIHSDENSKYFDNENIKEGEELNKNNNIINTGKYTTKREKHKNKGINKNNINSPSIEKSTNYIGHQCKTFQRNNKYNEDNNIMSIIPKHEEQFFIIDNKEIFSSPKEIYNKKMNNVIAITPSDNKNWNEINEYIKNEEISYKNKNKNDFIKIIGDKENEINLLQKKLNEIKNNVKKQKIFENNLEINNNLNEINIKGIKNQNNIFIRQSMTPRIFSKLEPEGITNNRFEVSLPKYNNLRTINKEDIKSNMIRNKSEKNCISLRNEINLKGSKLYQYKENNKLDEIINNDQFSLINIPKRKVKIVTKKILKKTNYIHSRFKDNKAIISSQNEFDIKRTIRDQIINRKRIFNEQDNKMSNENILNLRGIGKKFENRKININNIESINLKGKPISKSMIKLITNKAYENVIHKKSQFRILGKKNKIENIINRKSAFKIDGVKKDLSEKNCDTSDLIPKEIKITMKKVVKKTNIIKPKIKNEISLHNEIYLEGLDEPINQLEEMEKEYIMKKQEWNKSLKEEVQQSKFIIKRISKNIYNKLKDIKKQENKIIKNNKENIVDNNININIECYEIDEIPKLYKEKDMNLSLKIDYVNKNNIIVKKINIKLLSNKPSPIKNPEQKLITSNNWNDSLREEIQQSKFIIKRQKPKKSPKEIVKNIEITIDPVYDISKAKDQILENWNENNTEEKSEELNIEKQPPSKKIKITTKKVVKKTNYIYKKFENTNLNIIHNELNIKGRHKMPCTEYTSENSNINIIINEEYESKRKLDVNELISSKENEIFINAADYKKREIKIITKMSLTKTRFIHKRFKNNYISNENQIYIKRQKPQKKELEKPISLEQNEIDKNQEPKKEFTEEGIQKEDNIEKEEKTTDTFDLEKKEIKITTKKIVKKTNILKPKFKDNIICENTQLIINRTPKIKENDVINKINNFKINKFKKNQENIINKVSQVQLFNVKKQDNNYNIIDETNKEKNLLDKVKLHSKKDKINIEEEKESISKEIMSNNIESIDESEITNHNKKTNESSNFNTINIDEIKNQQSKTKTKDNEKKEGKKKRIKIKYIKNSNDNSLSSSKSSENKISINEDLKSNSSNDINEKQTIKSRNSNEIGEENKDMKSLEPKSTKKPFILRIKKVEVKKKILKSNSKIQKKESDDKKNTKMSLYNSLIARHFFQILHQNKPNKTNSMKKLDMEYIIKCLVMNRKMKQFKIHLIKYIFKSK